MDDTRFHDASPYGLGFQAGYLHAPQHRDPKCPFRKGTRPALRWHRGLRAGLAAASRRDEIAQARAAYDAERDERENARLIEIRRNKAAERFGSNHNP